ncbi:double zinc ribbon and ankyrin repeat-containing protein 1 isoform X3 [Oryzias latipes]|uniref:double zinc ribbon and ankyrin repeat-containing protein 1 isoform X3 n=1 Tax=Oryzias latipes TaxID=8090 RepID=UPI0009D92C10|nr:double zinc ribbon and ankyrin repeat-containing protein 1 isoform X3 [Oryzias latipes]
MAAGAVSAPLIIPITLGETSRGKSQISTRTPVSMHSDTAGALIFFTLDGSKPLETGRSAGSSRKYSKPVLLPSGRVSVRAVAVTSDGRQSSVVTKVFVVDQAAGRDLQDLHQSLPVGTCSSENPAGSPPRASELFHTPRRSRAPACFLWGSQSAVNKGGHVTAGREKLSSERCAQCLQFGPSDPLAQFCAYCGAPVPAPPGQTLPPAEPGQVLNSPAPASVQVCAQLLCVSCNSALPENAHMCLVCEEPVHVSRALQQVLCVSCGSGNPPDISRCLTCEGFLSSTPSAQVGGGALASCRTITCSRCNSENRSDARFCNSCGSKTAAKVSQKSTPSSDPTPSLKVTPPTVDKHTQTIGLYYPSFTELQRKEPQRQQGPRDPQPPLTAVSPGRGFWRKQLDHVCGHLRSYAQNNAPFRALLGEPRFGRMVSAVIQEDQFEVSLTVSFASAGLKPQQGGPEGDHGTPTGGGPGPASQTETLSSVTERSTDSIDRSGPASGVPNLKLHVEQDRAILDSQLLKELGPGGGRVGTVQRLLDQGADPSCCGSDGRHALAVAVMNRHPDVLPVLLQRGADPDQQSGSMKNTGLHEAAALGSAGLQCAAVLLRCNVGGACSPTYSSHLMKPPCFQMEGQREAEERCGGDALRCGGELRRRRHGVSAGSSNWTRLAGTVTPERRCLPTFRAGPGVCRLTDCTSSGTLSGRSLMSEHAQCCDGDQHFPWWGRRVLKRSALFTIKMFLLRVHVFEGDSGPLTPPLLMQCPALDVKSNADATLTARH